MISKGALVVTFAMIWQPSK